MQVYKDFILSVQGTYANYTRVYNDFKELAHSFPL